MSPDLPVEDPVGPQFQQVNHSPIQGALLNCEQTFFSLLSARVPFRKRSTSPGGKVQRCLSAPASQWDAGGHGEGEEASHSCPFLRISPTVLIQPKISHPFALTDGVAPCRVVRPLIALERFFLLEPTLPIALSQRSSPFLTGELGTDLG